MRVGFCINEVIDLGVGWNTLLVGVPELVLSNLGKNKFDRQTLLCPAVKKSLQNTFAIVAPFDMRIIIDRKSKYTLLEANPDTEYAMRLPLEFNEKSESITLEFPSFSLLANEDTDVEVLPPVYDPSEFLSNFTIAIGSFNIHRWVRPVGVGIIPMRDSTDMVIPKGTVLMYIRITPKNGSAVKLVRVDNSEDILRVRNACLSVKRFVKAHTLQNMYNMFTAAYSHKKWRL